MGIFNDITGVFNKGVEGAGRFADATSFKFRLGELERKRRNLAADLGENLYEMAAANPVLSAGCEQIIADIKACDDEAAQIKLEMERIARESSAARTQAVLYSCPTCGATLSTGARFCHVCGTPIAVAEPVANPEPAPWETVVDPQPAPQPEPAPAPEQPQTPPAPAAPQQPAGQDAAAESK